MTVRQGNASSKCYDKDKDLEYTTHILTTVLMCCGCSDLDPSNYSIDDVVSLIKDTFSIDINIDNDASNEVVKIFRNFLLNNYRRFWFNYQLIIGAN